jgi:hypothetical protein
MPVQRGYLHPYTNLRSTPDLCPDLGAKKRRKTRTDGLSVASTMDDSGGVGLWVEVILEKSKQPVDQRLPAVGLREDFTKNWIITINK